MTDAHDLSAMDPQAKRFLTMVSLGGRTGAAGDAGARRASFDALMRFSKPVGEQVAARDGQVAGIPVRAYTPEPAAPAMPGLLYFHGGGLVAGSLQSHDNLCRTLAAGAGCRVIAVGYRLAPEHPFPAAIVDALAVARAVRRRPDAYGLQRDAIAVGGDSGGGTLATIVAQVMRPLSFPKAQLLLCPVLDFGAPSASRRAFGDGFLLDKRTMAQDYACYAPSRPPTDPRISPLRGADLAGMPTTVLHTAGFDPLRDEGAAYAERLRRAGVPVRYTCHAALVHHFYALTGVIAAATPALSRIAEDLRESLG